MTGAYVTQNRNTREQPVFKRTQLDPSVMPHVDGNCHWGRQTYEEIALDALAAYTIDREYTEETVGDRNIKSRAYLDGFEAALICLKNAACRSLELASGPLCSIRGKYFNRFAETLLKFIIFSSLCNTISFVMLQHQQCYNSFVTHTE